MRSPLRLFVPWTDYTFHIVFHILGIRAEVVFTRGSIRSLLVMAFYSFCVSGRRYVAPVSGDHFLGLACSDLPY